MEESEIKKRIEVVQSIEGDVGEYLAKYPEQLKDQWQPSDFLPDPKDKDAYVEEIMQIRKEIEGVSDDVLIVLVGDMITEENLPTYQTMLNRTKGTEDTTGVDEHPYAQWGRIWTAQENRHGDVLNKMLMHSGRVNMKEVERSIYRLISNGMDMETGSDSYQRFFYPAFQERATKISHANTSKLARAQGSPTLARMCRQIARDEAFHENTYVFFGQKLFEQDPEGAMMSLEQLMQTGVHMPARFMDEQTGDTTTFDAFANVAQKIGVYTARHYAEIIGYLNDRFGVGDVSVKGEAARAQEYVMSLPQRYGKLAERIEKKVIHYETPAFDWVG